MSPYRSALLPRRAPRAPWWRQTRRWALDVLARVFLGRPLLSTYLTIRALSRGTHEDRLRYAYDAIARPFATPIRSPEAQLAAAFVAQEAENRANGLGYRRRYRRRAPVVADCEIVDCVATNGEAGFRIPSVEDTGQHAALFHTERVVKSALAEAISVRLLTEQEARWAEAHPEGPLSAFPGPPKRP